ncbi:hypothetical protein [Nakamurella lactea]|uniref:hypothetical protein n=1 Tax=Nakamurella lactea TaxID=459515 RepID=UPI001B7F846E|nr:hypothetical protein [Nakamurella lactea]
MSRCVGATGLAAMSITFPDEYDIEGSAAGLISGPAEFEVRRGPGLNSMLMSVAHCTMSSLTTAVATYRSAGFRPLPERLDRTRTA